jgi:hypothetical protein
MRTSDTRYIRHMRRYELAWRLIQHGARNRTVERWTGLSMYRVRALYEAYAAGAESPSALRGVAPRQVSYFWRSFQLRSEAAVLAGFLRAFEVFPDAPGDRAAEPLECVARGERLCRAYEEFKACWPEAQSTLEHAILLLTELVRGVEMALASCMDCDVLIVVDRLSIAPRRCSFCLHEHQAGRAYRDRATTAANGNRGSGESPGQIQESLF